MRRLLGTLSVLVIVCGPALAADPPGTTSCGSGGVDSSGNPCVDGKTTVGAASTTPFNGNGGSARSSGGHGGNGGAGGHGR
jgi:hypothetical protein